MHIPEEQIRAFRAKLHNLRALNAGWEGGNISVMHEGKPVQVELGRAGGMGIVTPELADALMYYAQARGLSWHVDNAAPLLSSIIAGKMDDETWDRAGLEARAILVDTGTDLGPFHYGEEAYTVRVWKIAAKTHTQYLFDQPTLWGRVAVHTKKAHTEPDIYDVPEGESRFPVGASFPEVTSDSAMAEFQRKRYTVFSQAVAAWYVHGGYDILIGNDYHMGLAPFYHPDILQITIGHNLGYQGVDGFYFAADDREEPVPIGLETLREQIETYCAHMGISVLDLYQYFLAFRSPEYPGTPIWLQAILRLNFNRCGLAATTVSQNYAEQLKLTRQNIEEKIRQARDFTPPDYFTPGAVQHRIRAYWGDHTNETDLLVPNKNLFDLTQYHIVGVLNGLAPERHLRYQTDFLRTIGLANIAAETPEMRIRSTEALTQVKNAARRALFTDKRLTERGIQDENQALHVAWGRLVAQKGFHVLLEEVTHITQQRKEVLVLVGTAPANDQEGLFLETRFTELAESCPNFVFVNAFDPAMVQLARTAADVAHMTSVYEPCGLSDIEAYWSGTLCVVHKVGGLIKGLWDEAGYGQVRELEPRGEPVAFGYDAYDTSDPIGEARAFRRAYEALIDLKYRDHERFAALQFKALNMLQFTYAIPANQYIDLVQYVLCFQIWRKLKEDVRIGRITAAESIETMCTLLGVQGDFPGSLHLDDTPSHPPLCAIFRDMFRPPVLYYVDALDRMLREAL